MLSQDLPVIPSRRADDLGAAVIANSPNKNQSRDIFAPYHNKATEDLLVRMQRASQLIGLPIRDQDAHPIGRIRDWVVDLRSAQVICGLVEPSRKSLHDYLVAVPVECFSGAGRDGAVFSNARKNLDYAPRFARAAGDPAVLINAINNSYTWFDEKPRWVGKPGTRKFSRFSQLTGRRVTNASNENLGKVTDLMIDLPSDGIVFAVLTLDDKSRNHYAVPPVALRFGSQDSTLLLNANIATIVDLARSDRFFWEDLTDPDRVATAYEMYGQKMDVPAVAVNADPTHESVRARIEMTTESVHPANSVRPLTDSEITQSILAAMLKDHSSNFPMGTIHVMTLNGRVILSGRVRDESQKQRLGAFAASLVGKGQVNNQLETGR